MIRVFRASTDDAEAASSVLARLYHRDPAPPGRLKRMLSDRGFVLLLAESPDGCVGYLHAEVLNRLDGTLLLLVYDIAVAPDRRREGIGSRLMDAALDLSEELGAVRCWLVTEPDNEAARGLYESLDGGEWPAVGFGWVAG